MATKAVSHKPVRADNSMAHVFIAAALGLLIFITSLQFVFSRIVWERMEDLVKTQVVPVPQVQETKTTDTSQVGTVYAGDLALHLPSSYSFSIGDNDTYVLSSGGAYSANLSARIHRADVTLDHTSIQGTQFMGSEEIGTSYSVSSGVKWAADFYYAPDLSSTDESLIAFKKVVHGIWWWPGY